jgi:hypothetical protein
MVAKGADVGAIAEDFNELAGRLRTALKQSENQAKTIKQQHDEIARLKGIAFEKSSEESVSVTDMGELD